MSTSRYAVVLALLLKGASVFAQQSVANGAAVDPNAQYVPGPDSQPHPGVPKGKVFEFTLDQSTIFPGTTRRITVYVPAEYRADSPACVYVGLDALLFEAPTVFDNLIYKHEMPVTIAVGVEPGSVDPANEPNKRASPQNPRFNRSLEFDGLNDNLARFLLEEVFPEVERHKTPDGLPIRLSEDPNDRAVGGGSTGGIGSFTLAWERPDAFRRVFIAIGTFVGMRGGDRYAVLVRKTEPKPIRIFMQDGSNDGLDTWLGEVGDWWMSNQTMARALEFAGYEVKHVWGEGSHDGRHATAVFPDAMRWLWKDWPQPIPVPRSHNVFLQEILEPGENWQAIPGNYKANRILAVDPQGAIVFEDSSDGRSRKLSADGSIGDYPGLDHVYSGLTFGKDSRVYVSEDGQVIQLNRDGRVSTLAQGIHSQHLFVTHDGRLYLTDPGMNEADGKIWLILPDGRKLLLDSRLNHPTGLALSPDGLWLAVAESKTHWGYSYRVRNDGSVEDKQRFYWFHVSDTAENSGAGTWVMDREGRLYSETHMGVQVFDRNGRVRAILPPPSGEVTGIAFGGTDFQMLYVSCTDHKLYRRKFKAAGAPSWAVPLALPTWSPG